MSYYVLIHMRPPMFVSDKDGNAAEFSTEGEAHDEAHSQTACLHFGCTVIDADTWDMEHVAGDVG